MRCYTLQRSKLLHQYVISNNISYHVIFKNLLDELRNTWNISGAIMKFYNERVHGISQLSNTDIAFSDIALGSKDEWMYFYAVRMVIGSNNELDWHPENVGSLFFDWLLHSFQTVEIRTEDQLSLAEQLDKAFTNSEMNISIINFAHLHILNDFKQLLISEDIANQLGLGNRDVNVENYWPNIPSSFYKCFNQENSYFKDINLKANSENEETYMLKSPCIEKRHLNVCAEYCKWTNESKKFFTNKEFMSLMKYASPQAKVLIEQDPSEYQMAAKIVGKESLKKKPKVAPVPLIILCKYQKHQGWEGEEIGMNARFCDSFVQVPSDVGICLSGAMNRADIFKNDKSEIYGEDGNFKRIKGGTFSSSATFILDTNYGKGSNSGKIQMQIHPRTELAQILHELNQDHSTRSFTLTKGHEYIFEVDIDGRIITENFRHLPIDQRKCKLQNEVADDFWFKYYSKRHCQYKCRTLLAYNVCGCIPWDIFRVGSYPECDVFGRTCFKNTLENITHSNDLCVHCYDDCQYLRYKYKLTKEVTDTIQEELFQDNYDKLHVKFSSFYGKCSGMKALCHYLEDKNHTLHDKYSPERDSEDLQNKFEGMIIVNIVFPTSKADLTVLDVRYTLIDKITSLGGSFGLFTQFTGCSIIAVIHLIILTIKQICIFFKDLKAKFCPRN